MVELKIVSIQNHEDEEQVIIENKSENELPYLFRTSDTIQIFDNGQIKTVRGSELFDCDIHPSLTWLTTRLNRLNSIIENCLRLSQQIPEQRVQERNHIMMILEEGGYRVPILSVEENVIKFIACWTGTDVGKITIDSHLENDLGLDSMDRIELELAVEEEFDTLVGLDNVGSYKTVDDLINMVKEK